MFYTFSIYPIKTFISENITPIGDGNLALSVFPDAKTLFNIRENITLIGDGN